jgi:F0F1-type ATP synthase membrane subunit a
MNKFEEFDTEPKSTNYKKWAYKVFIYMFLMNILVAFMIIRGNYHPYAIVASSWLATLLLLIGILLTIVSVKNNEEKNYEYHISVWGYPIFFVLTIISLFL